jgi:hypothetical protein
MFDKVVQCMVGDEMRVVDRDLFIDVHDQLADYYRAKGMTGDALDYAIATNLPRRLAEILDKTAYH